MALATPPPVTQAAAIAAALGGDERAFETLLAPYRRELHLHCYRMLGLLEDADDAMQETLLRAWRHLGTYRPTGPLRAWLYRIATNVCLTALQRRSRRLETPASSLASNAAEGDAGKDIDLMRLDPYPDHLLDASGSASRPEEAAEQRERIELAFVAAVQLLPARQRAVLLLRDVVGYAADEVAACLDVSVVSVNSALQRARATVQRQRQAALVTREHTANDAVAERQLVHRLITAWHAADIDALVATLTRDAVLTMPPVPDRYVGREAIGTFMATVPGDGRLDRYHLVPIRANRQPALAAYYRESDQGEFTANAIVVLAVEPEGIASIVRFGGTGLFRRFGLPLTVADRVGPS